MNSDNYQANILARKHDYVINAKRRQRMKASRFRFRAWDKKARTMYYGTPLYNKLGQWLITEENPHMCDQYGYIEIDEFVPFDTLMQLTGLTDKNGVEIFEGDVVMTVALSNDHYQQGATERRTVRNFAGNSCLCWKEQETGVPIFPFNIDHTIEVIGNIHENPELLKESK